MRATSSTGPTPTLGPSFREGLLSGLSALIPAVATVALMVLWAAHDGGYDADTWYWGALVVLGLLAVVLALSGRGGPRLSRSSIIALAALVAYVAWSYLSIAWADVPGWSLEGGNRALLYLLVFALFLVLPWSREAALATLVLFALGVGVIALVVLFRIAFADQGLVVDGRLTAPTGYFNSSVALFMIDALIAVALASRRELPWLVRGLLVTVACASLQLCVIGQSRGWLFTLPLVGLAAIALVRDRLRVVAAAVLPIAGTVIPIGVLLAVFQSHVGASLNHALSRAGRTSLLICAGVLVLAAWIARFETSTQMPNLSRGSRRRIGVVISVLVLVGTSGGVLAATHGDLAGFLRRQWQGFSHPPAGRTAGSHFAAVGSGRYDFWRVSLDAFRAHPIGGLGQDNFADYYVSRRRTGEEPRWTHSLEMRLLAHTGLVGFVLFVTFLAAGVAAAIRGRRQEDGLTGAVAGAALMPLVVWLIHGSVDWFWEVPALTAPALGFLAVAASLGRPQPAEVTAAAAGTKLRRGLVGAAGSAAFVAIVIVLGFPYLSVREVSIASVIRNVNPSQALNDLKIAAELNPLSADPGRIGGTIALQTGQYEEAELRFRQAISREPGGWYSWLGDGLAASALGDRQRARHDFRVAASINSRQATVSEALARAYSNQPLTAAEALRMLRQAF